VQHAAARAGESGLHILTFPQLAARLAGELLQQQRSGLGIEAQRTAVQRFAEVERIEVIAEFVEAETGKGANALDRRPRLAAALA
jgi:hypothetical protein